MELKGGIVRSNLKRLVVDKETREHRRITQQEIADATGLRRATISKWMSPVAPLKMIDSEALTKLAQFMEVGIGDMLLAEYPKD